MNRLVCVLSLLVLTGAVAQASVIQLTPNRDTQLLGAGTIGVELVNYGGADSVAVGQAPPYYPSAHALLGFAFSTLPEASAVESITLRLYCSSSTGSPANHTANVYSLSAANSGWVEGTSPAAGYYDYGACAAFKDSQSTIDIPWASGANFGTNDYNPTVLASHTMTASDVGSWVNFNFTGTSAELTSLVNSWRTDNADAGLVIHAPPSGTDLSVYYLSSRNASNPALVPQLIITENVPEPSSFVLVCGAVIGLLAYAWRKRR